MFKRIFLSTKILSYKSWLSIILSISIIFSVVPFSAFLVKALNSNNDVIFIDDFSTATGEATDPLGNDWQYGSTALGALTVDTENNQFTLQGVNNNSNNC